MQRDWQSHRSSCELAHHLVYIAQCYILHFFGLEIADGMRQLNISVPIHAFGAKLEDRRVLECGGDDGRRGNAAFFEFYCVVHTAQRAGASPADSGDGHLHVARHLIDQ